MPLLLALASVQAQSAPGAEKMLRDAAVNHDLEHARSLLRQEVKAENDQDAAAANRAVTAMGDASDAAMDGFIRSHLRNAAHSRVRPY